MDVIQNATVDDVRRDTVVTMEAGKPGGRSVIQNADFLDYGTPLENVEACAYTALESADY